MELVANVDAVACMELHTIRLLFCISGVPVSGWCENVSSICMENPLWLTLLDSGRLSRQCLPVGGPRWTPQESHGAHNYFPEGHPFQLFKSLFFDLHRVNEMLFLVHSFMSFGKCVELCNHHNKDTEQFCHPPDSFVLLFLIYPSYLDPWQLLICFLSL